MEETIKFLKRGNNGKCKNMNKKLTGIIKINPWRFTPVVVYSLGDKSSWGEIVENIVSDEITIRQQKMGFDNIGASVIFEIKNGWAVIKKII
jgi:hypothetical protein